MMGQADRSLFSLGYHIILILLIEDIGISVSKMPPSVLFLCLMSKACKRAIQLCIGLPLPLANLGSCSFLQCSITLPMNLRCKFSANLPEAEESQGGLQFYRTARPRGAVLSARSIADLSSLWTTSFDERLWNAAAVSKSTTSLR